MDLRKIDALVAEHVFGWFRDSDGVWYYPEEEDRLSPAYNGLPFYTWEVEAAWEVIEKICGHMGHWRNGFEDGKVIEDIYEAKLPAPTNTEIKHDYITEYAGSWDAAFQRAIVVWLKAKGVEVPG